MSEVTVFFYTLVSVPFYAKTITFWRRLAGDWRTAGLAGPDHFMAPGVTSLTFDLAATDVRNSQNKNLADLSKIVVVGQKHDERILNIKVNRQLTDLVSAC